MHTTFGRNKDISTTALGPLGRFPAFPYPTRSPRVGDYLQTISTEVLLEAGMRIVYCPWLEIEIRGNVVYMHGKKTQVKVSHCQAYINNLILTVSPTRQIHQKLKTLCKILMDNYR